MPVKKTYITLAVTALILAVVIAAWFFTGGFSDEPAAAETDLSADRLSIEPAGQLTISQGRSERFIRVINRTDTTLDYQIQLPPVGLTLEPREGTLAPGASREIILHVDDLYPTGRMSSMAYLRTEAAGENLGMDTLDLHLRVEPGELTLEIIDGKITALWNGEPALPGTTIYFRSTDYATEKWLKWYEIPRRETEPFFYTGTHSLRFMARFGDITSSRFNFDLTIEGIDMPFEPPEFEQIKERAARLYFLYMVGTDNPEELEYIGYSDDMLYMDLIYLMRRLDSSGYAEFMELQQYLEVFDVIAYIEHLISISEQEQEE